MVQERSSPFSAWLAPSAVALGVLAMYFLARPAFVLGVRPGLLLSELALVGPGLICYALSERRGPLFGERPGMPWSLVLTSLLAGGALWVASLGFFELQLTVWKPPAGTLEAFRYLHERLKPSGPLDAVVSVLAIAAAPAFCEELLFRGLVLPSLARPLGTVAATLITTLLFGAIHPDYRLPFACAVGLAFAALRLASGRLAAPMIAHFTLNTITFLVAPLTELPADGNLPDPQPLKGLALFAAGAVAAVFLVRRAARD